MSHPESIRRRALAGVAAVLSCASSSPSAQQILVYSWWDQPIACVITGRRVDGASVVLYDGTIGNALAPSVIAVPEDLWPSGAGYGESPLFGSLDLDCMMPAALDLLTHYRRSLSASSRFWLADVDGEPLLPNADRDIALIFLQRDAYSAATLTRYDHLEVAGKYAPASMSGDWAYAHWQFYRFRKELKRSVVLPAAPAGTS